MSLQEEKEENKMAANVESMFYTRTAPWHGLGVRVEDDDDKIRLNQRKPSKYKGLRRFGPEKNLQRINKFMKKGLSFIKTLFRWKKIFAFIWDAFTVSRKWWYYNLIAKTGPN